MNLISANDAANAFLVITSKNLLVLHGIGYAQTVRRLGQILKERLRKFYDNK